MREVLKSKISDLKREVTSWNFNEPENFQQNINYMMLNHTLLNIIVGSDNFGWDEIGAKQTIDKHREGTEQILNIYKKMKIVEE